jgi:hypothetical protein
VRAFFSEVRLDLREGALVADCTIDVSAWVSEVTIIVPPDVHVESDLYALAADTAAPQGVGLLPPRDAPRVRVTGTAHLAEVRVRVQPRA